MIFKETLIKSLSFAVWVLRFPHICRALLRFSHLSFIPTVPYPPLRGTFPAREAGDTRIPYILKLRGASLFL